MFITTPDPARLFAVDIFSWWSDPIINQFSCVFITTPLKAWLDYLPLIFSTWTLFNIYFSLGSCLQAKIFRLFINNDLFSNTKCPLQITFQVWELKKCKTIYFSFIPLFKMHIWSGWYAKALIDPKNIHFWLIVMEPYFASTLFASKLSTFAPCRYDLQCAFTLHPFSRALVAIGAGKIVPQGHILDFWFFCQLSKKIN